jgi:outer membrane protein assembly factor BamB
LGGDQFALQREKQRGVTLKCFRESDGKLLYQHVLPGAKNGEVPVEECRMRCSPLVEGNRLWYINCRSEVACLDLELLKRGTGEPKLLWSVDMRKEYGVSPQLPWCPACAGLAASVAEYKDWLYIVTANGRDTGTNEIPAANAPSLLCLEKATGKLVWKENSPGKNILEYQMSTPLVMEVKGRAQVIVGQGDGWLRSFDARTGALIWKCDLNPKDARFDQRKGGRNYVIATPVAYDNRIYVATGQDTLGFFGDGCLFCISADKEGDVSPELETEPDKGKPNPNSAVVWSTRQAASTYKPVKKGDRDLFFGGTVSTCTIHDGLVYAAVASGYLHCFDAKTGKQYWVDDLRAESVSSPLCVEGKLYLGTMDGEMFVFACGKEKKLLKQIETDESVRASPIFANGTLYITTDNTLFAIREKK